MADFCYQCSLDMYFGPPGDLNGLCKEGDIARVLCEGCGITKVDHRGWCISPYCDARHGEPPPGQLYSHAGNQNLVDTELPDRFVRGTSHNASAR